MPHSERIRILLVKNGNISESELARRLEISPQNLHNKMKRDNFTEKDLQEIAKALDCTYTDSFTINSTGRSFNLPIRYKFDVLDALKSAGYNTNRIRKEKIMGEATLQKIRSGEMVSYKNVETICRLLNCQPGDIMEYTDEEV